MAEENKEAPKSNDKAEAPDVSKDTQTQDTIPDWIKDPQQAFLGITRLQEKNHDRLTALEEQQRELNAIRKKLKDAEEAQLIEQKKWQELAEARAAEIETMKQRTEEAKAENARLHLEAVIVATAARLNFIDPAEAVALVDRSSIKEDDQESITAAVAALGKAKPHLLKTATKTATAKGAVPGGVEGEPDLSWHPLKRMGKLDFNPFGTSPPVEVGEE